MVKTFLDIHVLQSVPPSNLNRDDTGSPKTAVYGGVRRARVSSQAWKRAVRATFADLVYDSQLGVRTKRVVELIAEEIVKEAPDLEGAADSLAADVLKAVSIKVESPKKGKEGAAELRPESGYLVFFSRLQIVKAAKQSVADHRAGEKLTKNTYKAVLQADNSLDIALFGRMIADLTDLGVDASTQVAHAISVHGVESEADYFTAVDDFKQQDPERDAGAGMIGTVEFNSSTLYRYATVSLEQLEENLGSYAAVEAALDAFVRGFVLSMPTGKSNTFANQTVPAAVVLSVRTDRPVSFIEAFEEPVARDGGYIAPAIGALVSYANDLKETFTQPVGYWTAGVGVRSASLDELSPRTSVGDAAETAVQAAMGAFTGAAEEAS